MFFDDFKLALISCIITLLIVAIYVIIKLKQPLDLPKGTVNLDKNLLQTGDLISVSYNGIRGKLVRIFTGSMWTHIGMIYRSNDNDNDKNKKNNKPDEIYVVESASYEDSDGVIMTPLDKFIDHNKTRILAYARHNGPVIHHGEIKNLVEQVQPSSTNMFIIDWLQATFKRKYNHNYDHKNKKSFFCSEWVSYCLQELDMMDKHYVPASYSPKELLFGLSLPLKNDHYYDKPKIISWV